MAQLSSTLETDTTSTEIPDCVPNSVNLGGSCYCGERRVGTDFPCVVGSNINRKCELGLVVNFTCICGKQGELAVI